MSHHLTKDTVEYGPNHKKTIIPMLKKIFENPNENYLKSNIHS